MGIKNKMYRSTILIFLIVCIGCTYERPLLSIRTSREIFSDSVTHKIRKRSDYNYWGLRKITRLGGYSRVEECDSLGNKISVGHGKKKPLKIHDGNVRYYRKVCYYMPSGEKGKITKRIFQNRGRGGYVVTDKTIYFKNGKRIKPIEN